MKELNNMLIALLRSVLCGEELNRELFDDLDEQTLAELYKIFKKHDMAHVVGSALEKANLLPEGKIAEKLAKKQLMAVYRYENIQYEIGRICALFDKLNIPYILLKGAVIRSLYPEPWMRTSCDIDVLVQECDVDMAAEALVGSLGYKRDPRNSIHDIQLDSESGLHVELHYSLKENIVEIDRVLGRVWEHAFPTGEGSRYILSDEFFMYHFIAHASYHFVNGGCGFRTVCDMWLLEQAGRCDEAKVSALCREGGVYSFYHALAQLTEVWFGEIEHTEVTKRMEKYIIFGGTYGVKETRIAVKHEARGGKIGYLRSRIFVPYSHLKTKYPSLRSKAFAPVYQVKRWIDVVKDKKLSRYTEEFNVNKNLSDEVVDEIRSLMHELDLNKMIK